MRIIHRRTLLGTGAAALGVAAAGTVMLHGTRLHAAAMHRDAAGADSLTLYNGQHPAATAALVAAFTKATGIRVAVESDDSPALASRIVTEGAQSPADVFFADDSLSVARLAGKGLLARVQAATLGTIPARYSARDGSWLGVTARTRALDYNILIVVPGELPQSIMAYGTTAMRDRFGYVDDDGFRQQVMAIAHIKGRDAALDWLKGVKQYGHGYADNDGLTDAVDNGEIAMALSNSDDWYALAGKVGPDKIQSRLHWFPGNDPGSIYTVSAAGILRSSRRQAQAQRLLAFMVGAAGQRALIGATAQYPLLSGLASPFRLRPLADFDTRVTPADLGNAAEADTLEHQAGLG